MFGLIKKIYTGLLTGLVNRFNHTKWVSLSDQNCKIPPTLINLHPNEYNQEFHLYRFPVKLDLCVGSCNTLNDLCSKVCVPNKTEDLNLRIFNMITGINESKTLTKHISCEWKCKLDETKCNSINDGIRINVNVSVKTIIYVKKSMFGILLHVIVKMENI